MPPVERINEIISPLQLPRGDGDNINGPSCIRVPDWCNNKIGNYYLYFAHHSGKYIRMCYADNLNDKWTHQKGGVLSLEGMNDAHHHIASPELYVNFKERLIYMYFHSPSRSKQEQWTFLAISNDGINFNKIIDKPLLPFYMRVFHYSDCVYGMVKGGDIWKSKDGLSEFKPLVNPFIPNKLNNIWHNYDGAVRHVGLYLERDILHIFFSRIGDMPERILYTSIDLSSHDENDWRIGDIVDFLIPEEDYEGANLPLKKSEAGAAKDPENSLRDPYVICDSNSYYLFYSIAGEQGIAISKFDEFPK